MVPARDILNDGAPDFAAAVAASGKANGNGSHISNGAQQHGSANVQQFNIPLQPDQHGPGPGATASTQVQSPTATPSTGSPANGTLTGSRSPSGSPSASTSSTTSSTLDMADATGYWDLLMHPDTEATIARAKSASDASLLRRKGHLKEQDRLIDYILKMHETHTCEEAMLKMERWIAVGVGSSSRSLQKLRGSERKQAQKFMSFFEVSLTISRYWEHTLHGNGNGSGKQRAHSGQPTGNSH